MCDHCEARILEPMIAVTKPEMLDRKVRQSDRNGGAAGFFTLRWFQQTQ